MIDPHTHVAADLGLDGAVRNTVASTFGLVGDLPSAVATGFGLQVPRAGTSRQPEEVTCLPCREFADRRVREYAKQIERLGPTPGLGLSSDQLRVSVAAARDLAQRFVDGGEQRNSCLPSEICSGAAGESGRSRPRMASMDFEPLRADFLRITTEIVYCTVTTVDPKGRPR